MSERGEVVDSSIDPLARVQLMNTLEVARLKWRAVFLVTP